LDKKRRSEIDICEKPINPAIVRPSHEERMPLFLNVLCACLWIGACGHAWSDPTDKKGVGLAESEGWADPQLQALNVAWYYTWGGASEVKTRVPFVPMIFSMRALNASHDAPLVLGFNEPDNAKQSNIRVQEALAVWPQLVSQAKRLGSPAVAGNPVSGDWLPAFMKADPKVDFVTLHWYKGADAHKFMKDVQALCNAYQKPVWVTEFAPQTAAQSRASPNKYTQAQVNQFIKESVRWMNETPCVERFAWHDAKTGTSALWDRSGNLTPTGKAYAEAR